MLVLTRRVSEVIEIGQDIKVMVVSIESDRVRIGIDAPPSVMVWREEIADAIRAADKEVQE